MRYSHILLAVVLAGGLSASTWAEEHRQQGRHEHGGGQLNVALEDRTLMVELSVPAMNVVGFEHTAGSDDERRWLSRAAGLFKDGMRLFAPTAAAQCSLTHVTVTSALLDQGVSHDGEEGHADFDASYAFECGEAAQLRALTLSLFEQFPGTERLETQLITPHGQSGMELTAANNRLELK